jgi:hypothetical protein
MRLAILISTTGVFAAICSVLYMVDGSEGGTSWGLQVAFILVLASVLGMLAVSCRMSANDPAGEEQAGVAAATRSLERAGAE